MSDTSETDEREPADVVAGMIDRVLEYAEAVGRLS